MVRRRASRRRISRGVDLVCGCGCCEVLLNPFPLVFVYQVSPWVYRRKAEGTPSSSYPACDVVFVMGAHVFVRGKCTHRPRVRTAYDALVPLDHNYNAVGQRRLQGFRSKLSTQAFSPTSLLLIIVYKTRRFVCHGAPPDVASSPVIHGLSTYTAGL